ncbi:neutral zinc metallopeptidase [Acrocarpospora catenulata]|uniref:neutral zinc metallopeptidase n=1 Tax=Acrocarpospora catenulata TaxID=2836182 RepID=UPI0027E0BD4B|nr:neutral zinc metallopeptidase [Acrocarpospora catenulata]
MGHRRVAVALVAAFTLLSAVTGCGIVELSPPGSSSSEPESGVDPTTEASPGGQSWGCRDRGDTFASDVRLARCLTEQFWARQFQAGGSTYRPVEAFIAYNGNDGPACGGQPAVPNNAFYCQDGHFIAFDASWLQGLYQQLGDGAVYVVIPHEFGHAVQAQLMQDFSYSVERELQADCYAGGALSALLRAGQIQDEEGDDTELLANLEAAGDPTDAWWQPGAHGTPERRQNAYITGYQQGVTAC